MAGSEPLKIHHSTVHPRHHFCEGCQAITSTSALTFPQKKLITSVHDMQCEMTVERIHDQSQQK
jgi:hypothetical protein